MSECCVVQIPGPRGLPGGTPTNGTNGINAFTLTTAEFTMPAVGDPVDVSVAEESWASPNGNAINGQVVHVQFAGYFYVESAPAGGPLTLINLGYDENVAPGTVIPPGSKVSPAGVRGPSGAEVLGVLLAANDLSDVSDPAISRFNLGIGSAGVRNAGNANGELPFVDDAAGLTNGEAVFATATGIESKAAAPARAAIGVNFGIADTNVPLVNKAAGLINGEVVFATAAGVETLTAAAARTALGITQLGLAFKANKNAVNQNLVAGTTQLTFVELFDPSSVFTEASDRYIPGVVGAIVQINAVINFVVSVDSEVRLLIYKNGAAIAEAHGDFDAAVTPATTLSVNVSDLVSGAGDYYEVFVVSVAAAVAILGGITQTWFEGHRIG